MLQSQLAVCQLCSTCSHIVLRSIESWQWCVVFSHISQSLHCWTNIRKDLMTTNQFDSAEVIRLNTVVTVTLSCKLLLPHWLVGD